MQGYMQQARVAIRAMITFTLVLGFGYTFLVTGLAAMLFPTQAEGSLIEDAAGEPIGSKLLGQTFSDEFGNPLIQYFQPRPSATGYGSDDNASGGSNLGPENPLLIADIQARIDAIATFNGVSPADVPADAVTASASGWDPHISKEYALIQVTRIAQARNLEESIVLDLVNQHVETPWLGFIGESVVNVVELNLALDALDSDG